MKRRPRSRIPVPPLPRDAVGWISKLLATGPWSRHFAVSGPASLCSMNIAPSREGRGTYRARLPGGAGASRTGNGAVALALGTAETRTVTFLGVEDCVAQLRSAQAVNGSRREKACSDRVRIMDSLAAMAAFRISATRPTRWTRACAGAPLVDARRQRMAADVSGAKLGDPGGAARRVGECSLHGPDGGGDRRA